MNIFEGLLEVFAIVVGLSIVIGEVWLEIILKLGAKILGRIIFSKTHVFLQRKRFT